MLVSTILAISHLAKGTCRNFSRGNPPCSMEATSPATLLNSIFSNPVMVGFCDASWCGDFEGSNPPHYCQSQQSIIKIQKSTVYNVQTIVAKEVILQLPIGSPLLVCRGQVQEELLKVQNPARNPHWNIFGFGRHLPVSCSKWKRRSPGFL